MCHHPGCNGICAFEPFEREAIAAEAINEQRIRVGKKLITGECFPNGDCGQCILCDNAGGCLAESSKQIQKAVKEAIRQERERIIGLMKTKSDQYSEEGDFK